MTDMVVFSQSDVQRAVALAEANRVRSERAALKQDIKWRRRFASDLLFDVPEWAAQMRIRDLLGAVPGVGPTKIAGALARVQASPAKRVGGLTDRQRRELIDWLRERSA